MVKDPKLPTLLFYYTIFFLFCLPFFVKYAVFSPKLSFYLCFTAFFINKYREFSFSAGAAAAGLLHPTFIPPERLPPQQAGEMTRSRPFFFLKSAA